MRKEWLEQCKAGTTM